MNLATTINPSGHLNMATRMLRLVLYKNEVFRLPQTCREVRVVTGTVWVTLNGKDIMLGQGERLSIGSGTDFALVSALRGPVILEVWEEESN